MANKTTTKKYFVIVFADQSAKGQDKVRRYQIDGTWFDVPTNKRIEVPQFLAEHIKSCGDIENYETIED